MLIRHPDSALYETPKVASETDVCEATARAIFGALATAHAWGTEAAMSNADVFPYGTGRCVLGTEVNTKVKLPPVKATVRPGLGGGRKTPNESTRPSRSSTSLKPADVAPDDVAGRLCFRPNKEN